jgi:hypothetical protein
MTMPERSKKEHSPKECPKKENLKKTPGNQSASKTERPKNGALGNRFC